MGGHEGCTCGEPLVCASQICVACLNASDHLLNYPGSTLEQNGVKIENGVLSQIRSSPEQEKN